MCGAALLGGLLMYCDNQRMMRFSVHDKMPLNTQKASFLSRAQISFESTVITVHSYSYSYEYDGGG